MLDANGHLGRKITKPRDLFLQLLHPPGVFLDEEVDKLRPDLGPLRMTKEGLEHYERRPRLTTLINTWPRKGVD